MPLSERLAQLQVVQPAIAAHEREHERAVVLDDRHRLRGRSRIDAEERREPLDRLGAGRLDLRRRRLGRELRRRDDAARHLDVRGVVAAIADRDLVLAGGRRRHVLVGAGAAHEAGVRLDLPVDEAAAIEDARVRLLVQRVALVQARHVAVERVGVLHRELAGAQDAAGGPRLVALLRLDVVPDLREIAPGAQLARRVQGDHLLVRHRQHEVAPDAILQLEQLVDAVAAALLPELRRQQDRHQHLLPADAVHLLAHDRDGALERAVAERQPRPQTGSDLAGHARADEQPVGDRDRVRGVVAERRHQVARGPHRGSSLRGRRRRFVSRGPR